MITVANILTKAALALLAATIAPNTPGGPGHTPGGPIIPPEHPEPPYHPPPRYCHVAKPLPNLSVTYAVQGRVTESCTIPSDECQTNKIEGMRVELWGAVEFCPIDVEEPRIGIGNGNLWK